MVLAKVAIKRPIMTLMVIAAFVLLGLMSYFDLPVQNMPDFSPPFITVQIIYPGAGSKEIESNVTKKVEDELASISQLKNMTSTVMDNVSFTFLEFNVGKNINIANREVKDKLDAISGSLPDDIEKPVIKKLNLNEKPIINISFMSNMQLKQAYDFVDRNIKNRLEKIDGVAQLDISGGSEKEIRIYFSKHKLAEYNLTPQMVIGMIAANNINVPAGNIKLNGVDYSVKLDAEVHSASELSAIKIPTYRGVRRLDQIATVKDETKELSVLSFFSNLISKNKNNKKSINISVRKTSDANTVKAADNILAEVKKINSTLPTGMKLVVSKDDSKIIKNSVKDTITNIILGIILTGLILFLFLRTIKNTSIVSTTMPVVLVIALFFMKLSGFSLNMMTLLALSVSIGTLVANSIVILENIHKKMELGFSPVEAANVGTTEMADAVIASTLTNVAVFLPIAMMKGIGGQIFKPFGLTVTFVMFISIIVSFTLTPLMAGKILKAKDIEGEHTKKARANIFEILLKFIEKIYHGIMSKIVTKRRYNILIPLLTIIVLLATVGYFGKKLGNEFMPSVDEGKIELSIETPSYYNINKTKSLVLDVDKLISKHKEIKNMSTNIGITPDGKSMVNTATININLVDKKKRNVSTAQFIGELNKELAFTADTRIIISEQQTMAGSQGAPIEYNILGDNESDLNSTTEKLTELLKSIKGAVSVDNDIRIGKPEIKITPKREVLAKYGLTAYDIAGALRTYINGVSQSKIKEFGKEYDITFLMDKEEISSPNKIKSLFITTNMGRFKVSDLCNVKIEKSPNLIYRKNKRRMHKLTSYNLGKPSGDIMKEFDKKRAEIKLPEGISVIYGGMSDIQNSIMSEMSKALIIAVLLTLMLIAGLMESFLQSFLIVLSFPFSIIGIFIAMYVFHESMSIMTMMAIIMLLGVVVNNAILIIDEANTNIREHKMSHHEAILIAAGSKLRAIVMSSSAIIVSMLPLAIGIGEGAEMRQGMGIVSIAGIITSTLLILFVIPSLYVISYDIKDKLFPLKQGEDA